MKTQCCIAGGGPAGMMLGLLLARAGVDVVVLEKHADFLRDFRGDTVHPSTLELMHELGILEGFLARPHQKIREIGGRIGDDSVTIGDFSHLPTHCQFLVLMPQWDFLDFIAAEARRYPAFHLVMEAEVVGLLRDAHRVTGVRAKTPAGELEVTADLTVGADGRSSLVRKEAGLEIIESGAPIDVLWMRLPRRTDDPELILGNIRNGHVFVMLQRGDYWQCAFVIPKGEHDDVVRRGLPAFRDEIVNTVPWLHDRVGDLTSWDQIKLLTVRIDRLRTWYAPGLLCIGDAAHAMSPIGGVGINLAIQDAVAAANILARPLGAGSHIDRLLAQVQHRREFPTRATQWLQIQAQNRVLGPALRVRGPVSLPFPIRMLRDHPYLRRIPARVVGLGIRPEHIQSPVVGGRS